MTARDALRDLVLAHIPADEPAEAKRALAVHIKQAVDDWMETKMADEITAILHSSLQRRIEESIRVWHRRHHPPQAYVAEPEPEPEQTKVRRRRAA